MPRNIKRIEGAGMGGYRGDILSAKQAEQVARGMSGGRIGAGAITFEGWKDHIATVKSTDIKTWDDRNTDNIGSKLNGPKKIKGNLKKRPNRSYIEKRARKKSDG